MSWVDLKKDVEKSFSRVDRPNLVALDPISVKFDGSDGLIEKKAKKYLINKYRFELEKERPRFRNDSEELLYLMELALKHQDLRPPNKGDIHFTLKVTRVGTNDILRHQSMRFGQFGQSKQLRLNFTDNDSTTQIKYYVPPQWHNAPLLLAEFHSAMTYASHFVAEAIASGMPANQAKYPISNAATTELEMSGNLRSFFNYVGLRACDQAQFENQYLSNKVALYIKEVLPELAHRLGPRCVYEAICREGDKSCGKITDKKRIYTGKTRELQEIVLEKQHAIDNTIAEGLTHNDDGFMANLKRAHDKYYKLLKSNNLAEVNPSATFRVDTSGLDKLITENAWNTFKRLTGGKTLQELDFNPDLMSKVISTVIRAGHLGVLDHGNISIDYLLSRVMLQKAARHYSFGLMSSSQHHSDHSNFEYIVPPLWKQNPIMVEKFHTWMIYLSDLYDREKEANIPIDQARYVLPTAAAVNLRLTARPRSWLTGFGWQRSCPGVSWEERLLTAETAKILKGPKVNAPNIFYFFGPQCMINMCKVECDNKELALKTFRDNDEKAAEEYLKL